jgi:GNAT superfamily N-acetyltransferase
MTGVRPGAAPCAAGHGTYMIQPTADLRVTFLEAMREFVAETGTTDADGHPMAELESPEFLESYTRELRDGTCLRAGVEPLRCCEWWLVESGLGTSDSADTSDGSGGPGDRAGPSYVGRVSLRHHPARALGHLDFAIRPSRRREGHGTALLALALPISRANGVPAPVLVCEEGNIAGRKVIEANGGRLVTAEAGRVWYQITPGSRAARPHR